MFSLRPRFVAVPFLVLALNVLVASAAVAQDAITVGTVNATGATVDVPIYIRDVAGTPLGMDQPVPARIQAISIRVTYSPASAVSSVSFDRAGITGGLSPAFETKPASAGAVSLLASFQQSTNPIPFALNASSPGDLVAHLVFTLSASATYGSDIALTLDAATTQLTDDGGNAATKETSANGQLALVGGAIHIAAPSLLLSPATQSITTAETGTVSVRTSSTVISNATVTVTSSDPSVATVVASTVIAAGSQLSIITVNPHAPGSTTITATFPGSAGGGTAAASVTVTQATDVCSPPAAPQIGGPATALAGTTYSITWTNVANASEYVVDEASDAAFTTATSKTFTTNSAAFSHDAADSRYYYRVRARNHSGTCDVTSIQSTTISTLITALPPPAMRVLAVVGSTAGLFGSYFKTSLQLYNPKAVTVSGRLVFHVQSISGGAADPSFAYSIGAGKTLSFDDVLPAMGIATGLGSVDLVADNGSAFPIAVARIFSDSGAAGTTGFTLDALATATALQPGDTGALLVPADMARFRLNIGVRTLDRVAAMTVTVRNRDGNVVKTLEKTISATYFRQYNSAEFLDGFVLTGGETISVQLTSGAAFFYGATTDNITNDPSIQFATRVE
jgi:hypothetical protein